MDMPKKNEALKNRKVFKDEKRIAGIPSRIFVGFCGMAGAMAFLNIYLGIFFGVVMLTTLYVIHKDDPDAFAFVTASLTRPMFYHVGNPEKMSVKIVDENIDDSLTFTKNLNWS